MRRLVPAALCFAYVPILAWISLVATPAYVLLPWLSAFAAPVALAVVALGLLLNTPAARRTAWAALAVLGLWLAENVGAIFWHLVRWEQRQGASFRDAIVDALAESVTRVPYWLAALLPLCASGVYLWRSR